MELWVIGSIFEARTNIGVRAYSGALFFFLVYFLFSGRKFVSITLGLNVKDVAILLVEPISLRPVTFTGH